jgi:hypothetical protein
MPAASQRRIAWRPTLIFTGLQQLDLSHLDIGAIDPEKRLSRFYGLSGRVDEE